MTWKIRHQGSPRSIDGLTEAQVVEGLQDGLWEPTDEVLAPDDSKWTAIESHPRLAEIAAEVEAPPPKVYPDETRLDMNPLIDVALVLLIFFILTTSYAALQKVLQLPDTATVNGPKRTTKEVADLMITVKARQEGDVPTISVGEKKLASLDVLRDELRKSVGETKKTQLLIDAEGVDWGTEVAILDAAKGAGIQRAYFLKKKKQ